MVAGVREKKSAKLKLDILIACKQLLGKNSFNELFVDDICQKAGTSKVTFFKYFPQKDDVLLYYIRIWCLDRAVEFYHEPKEGIKGLYYLFDKLADTIEKNPGFILNLISYMTALKRPPSPFPLKFVERKILYPNESDLKQIEIMSIPQMMEKFLLEAVLKKEITGITNTTELTNLFLTVFYGSVITGHVGQIKPVRLYFRRNMENLMKGLH